MEWFNSVAMGWVFLALAGLVGIVWLVTFDWVRTQLRLDFGILRITGDWFAAIPDFQVHFQGIERVNAQQVTITATYSCKLGLCSFSQLQLLLGRHKIDSAFFESPEGQYYLPMMVSEECTHKARFEIPSQLKNKIYKAKLRAWTAKTHWDSEAFLLNNGDMGGIA